MRERIGKSINIYGKCHLEIRTPSNIRDNICGHQLTKDEGIEEKEITKNLLYAISEAYFCGYQEATEDARESVRRLLLETNKKRKPLPKITETIDYYNAYSDEERERIKEGFDKISKKYNKKLA